MLVSGAMLIHSNYARDLIYSEVVLFLEVIKEIRQNLERNATFYFKQIKIKSYTLFI